jgi:CBS-domain-containing membrane protein
MAKTKANDGTRSPESRNSSSAPSPNLREIAWAWIGGFVGISFLGYVHFNIPDKPDAFMLLTTFGSSAVIIFGSSKSQQAQPRSLIGGHLLSALVGVLAYQIFQNQPWLAASIGTATAITVMQLTKTLHPPGGATALIAVIGTQKIHDLGFTYIIAPVGVGAVALLLIALIINNLPRNSHYPDRWF